MMEEYNVKSLARAMQVLECFSVEEPELGISEIAKRLGTQKSTIFNILNTFQKTGYVCQNPKTNKYYLSVKILHLGYIVNHHMGLRDVFAPYLAQIAEGTNEVCYFGMLDNNEVLYIESAHPAGQHQARNILGERAPLHCTGLGKVMLAHLPPEEIEKILSGELKPFTPYTLCDPDAMRAQLEEIRVNGYAVDNMEHEFGVRCVAVPVFNAAGKVFAAVSVSGPSLRFDQATIAQHAQLITQALQPIQRCL